MAPSIAAPQDPVDAASLETAARRALGNTSIEGVGRAALAQGAVNLSVALIGPGAVGGVVAVRLLRRPGVDLTVVARTTFDRIEVTSGDEVLTARPRVITGHAQAQPVDWVLVATKAYDSDAAAEWFRVLVGPRTRVAILQNGVEHRERFAGKVPDEAVVPVMVDLPAERSGPGRIRQTGRGSMVVGRSAAGEAFAALFSGTGIDITVTDDLKSAVWRKLCLNSAGALTALTLAPSAIARHPGVAEFLHGIVSECVAVGRAEGAVLDDSLADDLVQRMGRSEGGGLNSLHADRLAGRPMEIDARNGAIVRFGRRHGIPTPCNDLVVALLEGIAAAQ